MLKFKKLKLMILELKEIELIKLRMLEQNKELVNLEELFLIKLK